MSEHKYGSLVEGLDDLEKRMKEDMPKWNEELSQAYDTMKRGEQLLKDTIRMTGHKHFAWNSLLSDGLGGGFTSIHWMLSYKQLAEHFDVPLSWIHVMKLKVFTDVLHRTWKVKGYTIIDEEGWLSENAYAAYCDGCDGGLLPDKLSPVVLRHPDMVKMSKVLENKFQQYADEHDMTLEEAMFALTLEHDMTVA